MNGLIRKIIKFSAVDGIGNRSAVFFQGCNLNCKYCHNPETIAAKDDEAKLMSAADVFCEIGSATKYIRGITASGGECTLQPEFLTELFFEAKKEGLTTLIDTNGTTDFSILKDLLEITDGVILDIKSSDDNEFKMITGKSNDIVLKNLEFLAQWGKLYEVRTVISAQMMDCEKTVRYVSKVLGKNGGGRYKLIKYRPMGVRSEYASYFKTADNELINSLCKIAEQNGVKDIVVV